ncbi:unnamed protein product [Mytilus edulis]|uniref:Uncharacterized protein n=1 Tax=Mytilus edulis TaxID=6550 RepID=A0A8S3VRK8_MYTED|nr:unnamed protein product [Mytilus edulis]
MRNGQTLLGVPEHELAQDVVTRWNSTQAMLSRLVEQHRTLMDIFISNASHEMRLERDMLIKLPMEDNWFNGSLKEMYHQMLHLTISELKKMFFHVETGVLCSVQYLAKRIIEKDEFQFGMGEKVHDTISDLLFERQRYKENKMFLGFDELNELCQIKKAMETMRGEFKKPVYMTMTEPISPAKYYQHSSKPATYQFPDCDK